ncbi:myosuppressin-like [Pollicipes pollicipes]|uniref:myosuppressin-like n=1 Tax=Pollicipes pollicipes TaxID=41117 RepID=UPI0018851D1C|nr:myosuppressin-like [Pollicipes pollicipes]
MQVSLICGLVLVIACLLVTPSARSVTNIGCRPEHLEYVPTRTKKLCTKILALREVQRAMEGYLGDEMRGELGLSDNGAKRQDVDHVFLRFGRAYL